MSYAEKIKKLVAKLAVCLTDEGHVQYERDVNAAIDEMQAEIDRLKQDAARYARLKDDFSVVSPDIDGYHVWAYKRNYSLRGANLDEAIDAAMKERGEEA